MQTGNKIALVTGGAKRVGSAIVRRLAAEGFEIAFTYATSIVEAEALVQSLNDHGTKATCVKCDLSQPASVQELIKWADATLGRLDVLVNNASAYLADDQADGASNAVFAKTMQINCLAPAALIGGLAGRLRASSGCVVNMIDIMADRPWPKYSAYCASKAALKNLTLSMARRLAPHVRVNGISPGVVEWPADFPEADRETYLKKVPLARPGTPTTWQGW